MRGNWMESVKPLPRQVRTPRLKPRFVPSPKYPSKMIQAGIEPASPLGSPGLLTTGTSQESGQIGPEMVWWSGGPEMVRR
ncbi:hypothetical protein HanRHA438_Chr04g0192521 [Helianthus annuus]|nr:hypothetical protein HanIR_Chr04g0196711 [Helianthus annuus]KAJ0928298.1 hypothetical protein HanRHA438_Chr04g0192521 [Helianthus annuus]